MALSRRDAVRCAALAGAMMIFSGGKVLAQTANTWTSAASDNWSNGVNWSTGSAPTSDPTLQLTFNVPDAATYTATNDLVPTGPLTLNTLTFATAGTGAATIASSDPANTLKFTGAGSGISLTGSGSGTITSGITWSAGAAVSNSGPGTLTLGSQTFANNVTISNSGTGTLTLSDGVTYGGSNVTVNLANTGGGTFNVGNIAALSGTLNISAGVVTFAGNTGGDLFGGNLILNVSAGASFNFANNAETMGGISGGGNIIMGTAGLSFTAAGDRTYTGSISGTGALTQGVAAVLTLGGANTYSGGTTINAGGTIRASAANALSPNSLVTVTPLAGKLDLGGFSQTIGGLAGEVSVDTLALGSSTLTINNNSTTTRTFNAGLTGAGNVASGGQGIQNLLGNNAYTGTTTVTAGTLRLNATNLPAGGGVTIGAAGTLDAILPTDATWTAPFGGTGALVKEGAGRITFAAANVGSNLSALTVAGGGITLDYSTDNGSKLGSNPAVTIGSGSLSLIGNNAADTTQNVNGLTIQGAAKVNVTSGSARAATVNAGAVNRPLPFGSTVNFGLSNPTGGTAAINTTTPNGPTGIVGGYATVNGADWAATGATGGAVTPLSPGSYTANTWTAGAHTDVVSAFAAPTAGTTADVRFNTPGAAAVTLAGANTVATGGILVTANVGAATSTIGGGSVTTPAGQDLVVNQYNTAGPLAISSVIANTAGTGITGNAAVTAGANTQTITLTAPVPGLYVGMLVTAGTNLPAASNGHILSVNSPTSVTIMYGTAPAASTTPIAFTFTPGTYVTKSGPGQLTLTGTNTFNGMLAINEGTVTAAGVNTLGASANGSSSIYFNGGTLEGTASVSTGSGVQPWIFGPGGGTVQTNGAFTLTKQGNTIQGSGTLTKTGTGTLLIGSNGSGFSGQAFINAGTFKFTSNQFASAGNVTIASGAQYQINDDATANWGFAAGSVLTLSGPGPGGSTNGAFALTDQSGTSGTAGGPISTFTNAIYLMADSSVGVYNGSNAARSSSLIFSGPISGPGGLTKIGNGTLTLTNPANSFTGPITVSGGMLLINGGAGGGSYAVMAGGTLSGGAAVGGAVTLTGTGPTAMANLAPGNNAIGKLEVMSGGVTFAASSSLTAEIGAASSSDLLKIDAGNLSLDPGNTSVLALVSKPGAFDGSKYVLANYSGTLSGTFGGVMLDGVSLGNVSTFSANGQTYQLLYNVPDAVSGSDIVLAVAVPEPTMMAALGVAVVALSTRRRRRA